MTQQESEWLQPSPVCPDYFRYAILLYLVPDKCLAALPVVLLAFWASYHLFLMSLMQVLLGLLQLGFLVTYLSEPLVRGYTTGAAIHVIVSQLKYTFGINPTRHNGPLSLIYVRKNTNC